MSRLYYWDKEARTFKEGYPPSRNNHFGDAPYVISDTMDKQYHPAACQWTESKKAWADMDVACGTFTSGTKQAPDPTWQNEQRKKRHQDMHESIHKAVAQLDAGTAPLTEDKRAWCEAENERIASTGVINPYNVVGRKTNKKGKRNGRRR